MCTTIQHMLPWPTRIYNMSAYPRRSQYFTMGGPFPPSKLVLRMGALDSRLIHASLGPPQSASQMASQSAQPFLHSSRQSPYSSQWGAPLLSKLPLAWGIWTPSNTWFLGPNQVHNPHGISIASGLMIVTDRPTDHAKLVTTGHIYIHSTAMWPNNNNLTYNTQCVGNCKSQVRAVFIHKYTTYNHFPSSSL